MELDNSGRGPLLVPGFRGIPIHYELVPEDRFAHGTREWRQAPGVTARELAMVSAMDRLTDKPGWHVDVFNDKAVAGWRKEISETTELMSEKAWSWCLDELRDKAVSFRDNQHVRVLDTGSCICKSDTDALQSLGRSFKDLVAPLRDQQKQKQQQRRQQQQQRQRQRQRQHQHQHQQPKLRQCKQQQHRQHQQKQQPKSDCHLTSLVDPSLYPLIYGRSLVLVDGGRVELQDVCGFYKDAKVAPSHWERRIDSLQVHQLIEEGRNSVVGVSVRHKDSKPEFYHWSSNYQRLPCEVEFCKDADSGVKITSYINNLHPGHTPLYRSIEELISLAIEPWNDCLVKGQRGWNDRWNQGQFGPVPMRIITYGIEWENELPEWALAFNIPSSFRKNMYLEAQRVLQSTADDETHEGMEARRQAQIQLKRYYIPPGKENMKKPPRDSELWTLAKKYLELPENGSTTPVEVPEGWDEGEHQPWYSIVRKQHRLLHFLHPEPGTAFSYHDWKAGNNNAAIIDIVRQRAEWQGLHKPITPVHQTYKISLQDTFREQGLQVIVKMDSIDLTPESPFYAGSSWQLEGVLNEHIVAVATFSYDEKNITEPRIAFRQETHIRECFYRYAEERLTGESIDFRETPAHRHGKLCGKEIEALSGILGIPELDLLLDGYGVRAFQSAGSVALPQGRLITFPNVMEHRVEPFELSDPTLPGHHRSVKLYLVDPHYRICSTRNVPPQQHDWWARAAGDALTAAGMPREIADEVISGTAEWPMGLQEARRHRSELMKEHRWSDMIRLGAMPRYDFH